MKKGKVLLKDQGFTLVELMVVVSIIGILSAIAIPNFKKYQAKSKTSEAKLQLSAAYTAEQSFYSDYDTYHQCLRYMGYNPTNEQSSRYYAVGFGSDTAAVAAADTIATSNGAIVGASACVSSFAAGETYFAAGKALGTTAAVPSFTSAQVSTASYTEDTFTLGAVGIIDDAFATASTASAFNIDQNKLIRNLRASY